MSKLYPITFLDMVQRAHMESGTAGSMPTQISGQVDQIDRLVTWVSAGWVEIQSMHEDWEYLRASASWVTDGVKTAYSPANAGITANTFSKWIPESVRNYRTASGTTSEIEMLKIDYAVWRSTYLMGANRSSLGRPLFFAIAPDKSICPGVIAATGYTITADYYIAPQPLVNDNDTPTSVSASVGASGAAGEIPQKYNMACIYWALMAYGAYENAPELYNRAEREFHRIMTRKLRDRLPQITMGNTLA